MVNMKGRAMTRILAIDQGTTSTRSVVFDRDFRRCGLAQQEIAQHYPFPGAVEHDPDDIWQSVVATARAALAQSGTGVGQLAAIGITNQRETTLLWDRATGQPLHPAIVWQDRRTAPACDALRAAGHEPAVREKTGLLLDPYFSATKLAWMLDKIPGARARAVRGELAFGTVDSWLIWRLTGGKQHATDATNASRTLLFDIHRGAWDAGLCALFDVPMALLPEVRDCAGDFGLSDPSVLGHAVPIRGVAGDQQAAAIGQACFAPGMVKSTYGTGCFALMNTGAQAVLSANRLLTTLAWQFDGQRTYALEGAIFVAGAAVQWLRDGLGVIEDAAQTQALAERADPAQNVVLVPAFTGLGAPWWRPECRGAVFGLTRNSGPAELARAALESVGYQTRDLWQAMREDWARATPDGRSAAVLRVDGGMARSDWTMQFLADILGMPVDRPVVTETTALGAGFLAAWAAGLNGGPEDFARAWALDRRFEPQMAEGLRADKYTRWQRAVAATMTV